MPSQDGLRRHSAACYERGTSAATPPPPLRYMITTATHEPLTDEEFERLGNFLEKTGTPGVNCEWVDGYFAALICGPELTSPSEGLNEILGDDVVFDSKEQASDIVGLLMRHWNTIVSELQRNLANATSICRCCSKTRPGWPEATTGPLASCAARRSAPTAGASS